MKYYYCSVKIDEVGKAYSYISDIGELEPGTLVQVPFGSANTICTGEVMSCKECDETNVPYPIEKTKHIISVFDDFDLDALFSDDEEDEEEPASEIELSVEEEAAQHEGASYIIEDMPEEAFYWAYNHADNPHLIDTVIDCYKLCLHHDNANAALNLGSLYYNGLMVTQDYEKAVEYYRLAAKLGAPIAYCNLGYCYYYGRAMAVDYKKAYEYYNLGALRYGDYNCLYKLGDMYLNGYYVEKDEAVAFALYERAYNAAKYPDYNIRDEIDIADVEFRLGKCYLRGIGTDPDLTAANHYLHSALAGFYDRRATDPFVSSLIKGAKELVDEIEAIMDKEII